MLTQSGVVRSDIRSSFGSSTDVADGVPLTIKLTVVDTPPAARRSPGPPCTCGTATATGNYSLYSDAGPARTTSAASRRPTPTDG